MCYSRVNSIHFQYCIMSSRIVNVFIPFIFLCVIANAQDSSNATPLSAAKAWWHATTFGDTAYLKKHSTPELTVTFNSGRSFTHSEIIAQVATHDPLARINSEWSDILVQTPTPQTAIVTNRIIETVGSMPHTYKFITVLVHRDSNWKVAAAQSTRVVELAPPFTIDEPGKLQGYAGTYRTPGGVLLTVLARDTSLIITDPSGRETRLAAIGLDLFEIP